MGFQPMCRRAILALAPAPGTSVLPLGESRMPLRFGASSLTAQEMTMRKTILSFGEILWDLLPGGAKLGGAPFNFACRAGHLGDRAVMVSRLGRDQPGKEAFDQIRSLGMETIGVQWDDDHPTGTVEVSFDADGNPDYVIIPDVAYDYTEATDELIALAASADCVCFGTLAQRAVSYTHLTLPTN
mgnify:CR=1 FL=1